MATNASFMQQNFDIGRVFNMIFAVAGRNAVLYLGLGFLVGGLPQMIFQYFLVTGMTGVAGGRDPAAVLSFYSHFGWVLALFWLVMVVLSALLQASLSRATVEDLSGRRPGYGESLSVALSVLPQAIGISLLVAIGSSLAMILLIVPGIILWLGWCVTTPVLVQEREGVFGSMSRSRELTKGSRWALFALFLIIVIVIWVLKIVLGLVFGLSVQVVGPFIGPALTAGISSTISTVALATASAASYVELRQVKEGSGIDELAQIFA
jgi:uncharacterized membrane protein